MGMGGCASFARYHLVASCMQCAAQWSSLLCLYSLRSSRLSSKVFVRAQRESRWRQDVVTSMGVMMLPVQQLVSIFPPGGTSSFSALLFIYTLDSDHMTPTCPAHPCIGRSLGGLAFSAVRFPNAPVLRVFPSPSVNVRGSWLSHLPCLSLILIT